MYIWPLSTTIVTDLFLVHAHTIANLMLYTFSAADPSVKSRLLQTYCLSLYGCSLWNLSCQSLNSVKISFNNILRRIWRLPRNCHTGILHLTACLPSLFNLIISRSSTLLSHALLSPSHAVRTVFHDSSLLAYTQSGFNEMLDISMLRLIIISMVSVLQLSVIFDCSGTP